MKGTPLTVTAPHAPTQVSHVTVLRPAQMTPRLVLLNRDLDHYTRQVRLALTVDLGYDADRYGALLRETQAEIEKITKASTRT